MEKWLEVNFSITTFVQYLVEKDWCKTISEKYHRDYGTERGKIDKLAIELPTA
ncbi:hypothetical protein F3157_02810 [Virgibacillus dakarensis]|nr:hypothetical protein [Virgibacillus dakarensis]